MAVSGSVLRSSASMVCRPFEGIDSLHNALANSTLVLDGESMMPGILEIAMDKLPFSEGQLQVLFDSQEVVAQLTELNLKASSVDLVVLAQGSTIASSEVLHRSPLSQISSPQLVDLNGSPLVFQSRNGFTVLAALVLNQTRKAKGLQPHLAGTLLAITSFRVTPESTLSRFAPTPLDAQIRQQLGLPPTCLTYVLVEDDLLGCESLDDQIQVFVDASILRLLQEDPDSPTATYLQVDLAMATLSTVLTKIAAKLSEPDSSTDLEALVTESSPIIAFISPIAKSTAITLAQLIDCAIGDPGRLRSVIEAYLQTLKFSSLALREVR
jgi:hypothetical protein